MCTDRQSRLGLGPDAELKAAVVLVAEWADEVELVAGLVAAVVPAVGVGEADVGVAVVLHQFECNLVAAARVAGGHWVEKVVEAVCWTGEECGGHLEWKHYHHYQRRSHSVGLCYSRN